MPLTRPAQTAGLCPVLGRPKERSAGLTMRRCTHVVLWVVLPVVAAGCSGCSGPDCRQPYVGPGLIVTVVNDQTGEPICDAAVTVQTQNQNDGVPWRLGVDSRCRYTGAWGDGVLVRAERAGFRPDTRRVDDIGGECGYDATPVTMRLVPLSQ